MGGCISPPPFCSPMQSPLLPSDFPYPKQVDGSFRHSVFATRVADWELCAVVENSSALCIAWVYHEEQVVGRVRDVDTWGAESGEQGWDGVAVSNDEHVPGLCCTT